jgi:hypothetical protein
VSPDNWDQTLAFIEQQTDRPDSLNAKETLANVTVALEEGFTGRMPKDIIDHLRDLIADRLGYDEEVPPLEPLVTELLGETR